jgi:NADPH:quinone reductase-like Zn-dependent oxidoreductase
MEPVTKVKHDMLLAVCETALKAAEAGVPPQKATATIAEACGKVGTFLTQLGAALGASVPGSSEGHAIRVDVALSYIEELHGLPSPESLFPSEEAR